MKSFGEKLLLLWKRIIQSYADYRVTVCAVALLTIYGAMENLLYIYDYDVREQMRVWKYFDYSEEISVGLLLLLLGTVYLCHRKSGVEFAEYMLHVLANLCVTTAVYIVLSIGVSLVLTVVDTLFVDSVLGSFATAGTILVTGLYYVPCCITALRNMDSDIDKAPGKYLLRDVITSLTIFAMMIVYTYLFKILLLWELPSNEVFGIIAGIFCFGMPIWVMDYYYQDETRYMGMAVIVFECEQSVR